MAKIFLSLLSLFILSGCASSEQLALVAGKNQTPLTRDGVPALISKKRNVVLLRPVTGTIESGSRPGFVIAVNNLGKKPADLKVSQISASIAAADGKAKLIHVYGYDELVAEEKRRQRWAAVGAAFQGAAASMNAANAGYSRSYGTYSANSYGSYNGSLSGTYTGSTYGTYSATTYDEGRAYAARQLASAQTSTNFANIRAAGERNLALLQNTILKDNTVMPGEWIGGRVIIDSPGSSARGAVHYTINVEFDGEMHSFRIAQSRTS